VQRADVLVWYQGALGELKATVGAQHLDPTGPAGGIYANELFIATERFSAVSRLPFSLVDARTFWLRAVVVM